MFCETCGAPLPQDARFCEKCGSPVRSPERIVGWKAEIAAGVLNELSADGIAPLLAEVARGGQPFFTLTPPQLIDGSRYMQCCSDDAGALHVELCMARGTAGFEIYAVNGVTVPQAAQMFLTYLRESVLPVPPVGSHWQLV